MNYTKLLSENLAPLNLLKHPFYQKWNDGSLSVESLQKYAKEYYHHVKAFPRYLSATHSQCDDLKSRQFLLQNLCDEEAGDENHPELWLRFAESLGLGRDDVKTGEPSASTRILVNTFFGLAKSSFAEGIGALYAYEHQIPAIAEFKKNVLEKHYGMNTPESVQFFEVHRQADVYHTATLSEILEGFSEADQAKAKTAAQVASTALWSFLDTMPCD